METYECIEKALVEYAQEMQMCGELTVADLIASHKRLREKNSQTEDALRAEVARQHERGYEAGRLLAMERDYISRERLTRMTLRELSELLKDDSEG